MEQDPSEGILLMRLVNPDWDQNGVLSSQAFRPMNDRDLTVSFYNGDMISPEDAYNHFTGELGNKAIYVVGVPTKVILELGLKVDFNGVPYPSHVNVDFSGIEGKKNRIRIAKQIKEHAHIVYKPRLYDGAL